MRNSILIQLTQVWQATPQKTTFAIAINTFLNSFERIFEVDNLLPSLARNMFECFLMQYESESETESKKAPLKQIEPLIEKQNEQNEQNENSFFCECGAKFQTVQARSGHKKGCKI